MHAQALLELLTEPAADLVFDTTAFIDGLNDSRITALTDPFERLVYAAMRAGSHANAGIAGHQACLLYTSPSPRDATLSRMPSSA